MTILRAVPLILAAGAVATLTACSGTTDAAGKGSSGGARAVVADVAPQSTPPDPAPVAWGQRHIWGSGLAVEVGAPAACAPTPAAYPANIERAVKVPIVVTNGTAAVLDTVLLVTSDARFDGQAARVITDIDGPCGNGVASSKVPPGQTVTTSVAVAVGAAPGELRVTLGTPPSADKAVFAGPA